MSLCGGRQISLLRDWILLVCFSWRYEWQRVHKCTRVNFVMREALSKFTRGSSVFHTSMRNKQVNSILIFIIYQNCTVLATKYPFFNTKHPVIILRASLFVVTPSHVASWQNGCQNFSYVYRSRKHWNQNILDRSYKYIYRNISSHFVNHINFIYLKRICVN